MFITNVGHDELFYFNIVFFMLFRKFDESTRDFWLTGFQFWLTGFQKSNFFTSGVQQVTNHKVVSIPRKKKVKVLLDYITN